MEYEYTRLSDGIRIHKPVEPQRTMIVPDTVDGLPVTEIDSYAFAGTEAEEVKLPVSVKKIGAYAFYNCAQLRSLSCGSRATDLGTGLFAGAGKIEFLEMTVFPGEKSCLKEMLSELRQTLRVRLELAAEATAAPDPSLQARLIFPEYFEEWVENTPARILFTETHGCGHRYRYCFDRTQFQYDDYDALFPYVQVEEKEALVTELALGRLFYPLGLSARSRDMYLDYVAGHWEAAGKLLIAADRPQPGVYSNLEPGMLPWLVEQVLAPLMEKRQDGFCSGQLERLTRMAQEAGDGAMVAWLMDYRYRMDHRMGESATNDGRTGAIPPRHRRFTL